MSSRLLALASRAPTTGIVGYGLLTLLGRTAIAQGTDPAAGSQVPAAPPSLVPPAANPVPAAPPAASLPAPAPGAAPVAPPAPAPVVQMPANGTLPQSQMPATPIDGVAPAAQAPALPADGLAPAVTAPADGAASAVQGLAPAADGLAPAAQAVTQAVPPPTGASVEAVAHVADHSLLGLVIQAGPVVQGVMGALVLASIVCWAIMIEKGILLGRLQREVKALANTGDPAAATGEGLAARVQRAAAREWAEGRDHDESRGEYRERIERAMRETLSGTLRRAQHGTAFLATTGAVGPFVGLFGTVWGIMGSFQGIAQMRDTSLAVVAPGIAEALLATAIGLFAAIPAVIGYNRIARRVAGLRADAMAAIAATGARLSGRPPRGGNLARAAE